MNKGKKIRAFSTYSFIKRALQRRYGKVPFIELNDILGAELVQLGIESESRVTLDCHLSVRLFELTPEVFEPIFTRLFFSQLVAFVDAQRLLEITINDALLNYLKYNGLTEEDISLPTAKKIYDRYRYDKY